VAAGEEEAKAVVLGGVLERHVVTSKSCDVLDDSATLPVLADPASR
jgi:hypothetical protein